MGGGAVLACKCLSVESDGALPLEKAECTRSGSLQPNRDIMENEGGDYNYTTNGDGEIEEVAVAAAPPGSIDSSQQSTTGG